MLHKKRDYISNLSRNAFFPISAAAFFLLTDVPDIAKAAGILTVICISMYCPYIYIYILIFERTTVFNC